METLIVLFVMTAFGFFVGRVYEMTIIKARKTPEESNQVYIIRDFQIDGVTVKHRLEIPRVKGQAFWPTVRKWMKENDFSGNHLYASDVSLETHTPQVDRR